MHTHIWFAPTSAMNMAYGASIQWIKVSFMQMDICKVGGCTLKLEVGDHNEATHKNFTSLSNVLCLSSCNPLPC